jgi:hypothetical protein
MTIENGTAIVLAYVLVSIGVIVAFVLAVFMSDVSLDSGASAAADSTEKSSLTDQPWRASPRRMVIR